jgi:hypothetical protein
MAHDVVENLDRTQGHREGLAIENVSLAPIDALPVPAELANAVVDVEEIESVSAPVTPSVQEESVTPSVQEEDAPTSVHEEEDDALSVISEAFSEAETAVESELDDTESVDSELVEAEAELPQLELETADEEPAKDLVGAFH